jgi:hypothetical protein
MKGLQEIMQVSVAPPKKKLPTSERALIIQDMADLAEVPFIAMQRKTFHIPGGDQGTRLLKSILEEAQMVDDNDGGKWQKIKLWSLIKKTR